MHGVRGPVVIVALSFTCQRQFTKIKELHSDQKHFSTYTYIYGIANNTSFTWIPYLGNYYIRLKGPDIYCAMVYYLPEVAHSIALIWARDGN